jgi:hypothetical protein
MWCHHREDRMPMAVVREPLPPISKLPEPPAPIPAQVAPAGEGPSAFGVLLQSLAGEIRRGESLTRSALSMPALAGAGHAMGPAELIALQAGIYRYGEAVDLASRLVDRVTGAVKTVVQGS